MTAKAQSPQPLNETQLMLLRLFSRQVNSGDMEAIRNMLLGYYEKMLHKEVENVINEKGITRDDFEKVLSKQQRTK
ncbi:MAG TPA: hypothetical protein ENJ95_00905 [Bacteroidetes bacterium]|nr:hypothetical protein [Bacteroidota bacterium]